jgi:DNA integrity scanning protein DisA with diadenylate cyclase activity
MSENFDNSMNIPTDILKKHEGAGKIKTAWSNYLQYKFRYLLLLETKPIVEAEDKIECDLTSSKNEYLNEFIPKWKIKAKNERVVCLYRYCQLQENVVEDTWYYQQIQECHDWCRKRKLELEQLDNQVKSSRWTQKINEIYKDIGHNPFSDCRQERLLSEIYKIAIRGLAGRVNSVHKYLQETPRSLTEITGTAAKNCQRIIDQVSECFECHYKDNPSEKITLQSSMFGHDLLSQLSLDLIQILHSSGFDETAVITTFLTSMKENFHCEVCDFLDVTNDNKMVVWSAATVNHKDLSPKYQNLSDDDLRQKIRKRESYEKGEGISGSILLTNNEIDNDRNIWVHIGSNDVRHDPRQSKKHKSAYEKDMYPGVLRVNKQINNFWMFPIFEGIRLSGAFRVVNKLNNEGDGLLPGGWPYFTRVQLALIAQWFSRFLETIRPQLQAKEDYIALMERNARVDEMIRKFELGWIQKRPFQALLRHIASDISKKQEKRGVGCCITIVETKQGRMPLQELDPYPLLECTPGYITEPYNRIDSYHDVVNPLMGTYVFDQNGNFIRIARLEVNSEKYGTLSGDKAIKWVTKHNKSVCLMLPLDTKNILVYHNGEKVAEIHVSETTAKWRFRYPQDILEKMKSMAPKVNNNLLEIICDACIELSYRSYGAIIVVGDIPPGSIVYSDPKVPHRSEWKLDHDGKAFLVEFAKMDGATFISSEGCIIKTNRNVNSSKVRKLKPQFPGRGARHETGEKISIVAPEALVMIVSENRGISMIASGGERVFRDL